MLTKPIAMSFSCTLMLATPLSRGVFLPFFSARPPVPPQNTSQLIPSESVTPATPLCVHLFKANTDVSVGQFFPTWSTPGGDSGQKPFRHSDGEKSSRQHPTISVEGFRAAYIFKPLSSFSTFCLYIFCLKTTARFLASGK